MYVELQPSRPVDHLIDRIWIYQPDLAVSKFKVLPDGCTDLIFDLQTGKLFVSGAMSRPKLRTLKNTAHFMGLRFKTEHFASLANFSLTEIRDTRFETAEVGRYFDAPFIESLVAANSDHQRKQLLENAVVLAKAEADQLADQREDKLMLSIAKQIRTCKGHVDIAKLSARNYLSLRQMERRFKRYVGLGIKEFASIIRFDQTRKAISNSPGKPLYEIALSSGFYDQAHMANEFKRLSGASPRSFR